MIRIEGIPVVAATLAAAATSTKTTATNPKVRKRVTIRSPELSTSLPASMRKKSLCGQEPREACRGIPSDRTV